MVLPREDASLKGKVELVMRMSILNAPERPIWCFCLVARGWKCRELLRTASSGRRAGRGSIAAAGNCGLFSRSNCRLQFMVYGVDKWELKRKRERVDNTSSYVFVCCVNLMQA